MLSKTQIRFLKSEAHHLHPIVMIGTNGLSDAVQKEINLALDSHELVKIKLGQLPDEEQAAIIEDICRIQQAEFVQKIGHIAVIYRSNPEKKRYSLPK
ncbi:ribosome assembly RNA-binding protein YhbY [Suttonella indologenes]|uniref:RNA-binding protein HI_1333 n=1 Tax=Suttonella indologenes TaxID=13276 RepID=A0A380MX42_9GAMM|nr:ribosome assembly RNA-binding protein YhbY [Suttonella indologenes]SUO96281.1 RNA-binding protein HI_1333 [Suttonella indologenes]